MTNTTGVPTTTGKNRNRPALWALAAVLVVLCGLGALWLYNTASEAVTVVQVRKEVHRGATIKATDLTTVTIGNTPGVETVPGEALETLVGQQAKLDLAAGSLLAASSVTREPQPPKGHTHVGLQLTPGRVATSDLTPGNPVRLVVTAPEGDPGYSDAFENGSSYSARLISAVTAGDGTSTLMNVDVAADTAPIVAQLAAQGRLAVVLDSAQG